jgi:hypothetical protein
MKPKNLCGWIAALSLCVFSTGAFAQARFSNTPESPEVLNAESSEFVSTIDGVEAVTDGSFEAGTPNPFWTEASTNFGTPLCTIAMCGTGTGTGPHTGNWWAWFGGISAVEEGSVSQMVTFPAGGAATLSFWLEAIVCASPNDFLEVLVDGNQEYFVDGSYAGCGNLGYLEQFVDLGAYADGGVHNLEFHSQITGAGTTNFFVDDVSITGGEPPALARFLVTKDFDDDNPGEVDVTVSCNTGLPLVQTIGVSEGAPINFVVGDFEQGAMNCSISEGEPDGYTAVYNEGAGCDFEALVGGQYFCNIDNNLDPVEVVVTKVWIDENPQYNAQNIADASWYCDNVAFDPNEGAYDDSGLLSFYGNPGVDSFFVYPSWDGGTHCSVTEVFVLDSGIEIDDSECDSVVVFPGAGGSCTIYNTRLYEGIPTLSQYGLAVLALLMLGVGFVGFRRFV